jgi:2-phosphosulfolactate phosphatase
LSTHPIQKSASNALKAAIVLDVALLPSLVPPEALTGQTVVVVDVLRATTTIVNSLNHGAVQVLPQPSVESARTAHESHAGQSLLCGERGGQIVDGFHHGNSPLEYKPEVVADKTLILATTNGTVAMERCRAAKRVLIGAMVNLEAVANVLANENRFTVVCSGTDGEITSEDVLFAGAVIDRVLSIRLAAGQAGGQLTDQAQIAVGHWRQTKQAIEDGQTLVDFFRNARGGINLVRIGHDLDIQFAANIDSIPILPELDIASWSIRIGERS